MNIVNCCSGFGRLAEFLSFDPPLLCTSWNRLFRKLSSITYKRWFNWNTVSFFTAHFWVQKGYFFGLIPRPPFQMSSPVPSFSPWCSLVTQRESRRIWHTTFNQSSMTRITSHWGGKIRSMRKEQDLEERQPARCRPHRQLRRKSHTEKAAIHILWYPLQGSYLLVPWSTLPLDPSRQPNTMVTHFLLSCHPIDLIMVCSCPHRVYISIPRDPTQGNFTILHCTIPPVKGLWRCIHPLGIVGHPCTRPQGMFLLRFTRRQDTCRFFLHQGTFFCYWPGFMNVIF